jgi:hypothetical protein
MQLPTEQYVLIDMPMNSKLSRLSGNDFLLVVPPVTFFDLKVLPEVYCTVSSIGNRMIRITSEKCNLSGSEFIDQLNSRFKFKVVTEFTWSDTPSLKKICSRSRIVVDVDPPFPFSAIPRPVLEATGNLAMKVALDQIEKSFIESLSLDYARWASDERYRSLRAGMQDSDLYNRGTLRQPV